MKRDMDLVRKILMVMADNPEAHIGTYLEIEGYSQNEIGFNLLLMSEGGLVKIDDVSDFSGIDVIPDRLTWEGSEFLELSKDDKRWKEAKSIMAKVGGFAIELFKPVLVDLMKEQIRNLM